MNSSQAFEILGLEPTASPDEIEERFRELVPEHHPDVGGTEKEMKRLQKARDTALAENTEEIEPLEQSLKEYTERVLQHEENHRKSEKTVESLIDRQMSKYRRKRQLMILFGGVFGVMLIMLRFYNPSTSTNPPPELSTILPLSFIGLTMFSGMLTWMFHTQMQNIETLINEADEALDDKNRYLSLLEEIGIDYREDPSFTRTEVERRVAKWLESDPSTPGRKETPWLLTPPSSQYETGFSLFSPPKLDFKRLARTVGASDFSRLFFRKGLENNLIRENERMEDGEWKITYRIDLPSDRK